MSHVYEGARFERATSRESLATRLSINKAYASADFDGWLLERLQPKSGEDVLDVGCGTGAQTLPIAERVGAQGSVSAMDISAESIATLKAALAPEQRVQAEVGDMADLARLIRSVFAVKSYDLAQSTYALYYAKERLEVLRVMTDALKPGGRLAVFSPAAPHGLVELAARCHAVPQPVYDSLNFGPDVVAPWFEANLRRVEIHRFHNEISIPSAAEAMAYYRATTYYDAEAEDAIRDHIAVLVAECGAFRYEKNGILIVGYAA